MPLVRRALWCALLACAALLAARMWIGPNSLVRTPINVEGAFGVAALLLLATAQRVPGRDSGFNLEAIWCVPAIVLLTGLAFWASLSMPLISDDYVHVTNILRSGSEFWGNQFTVPSGDLFFRPFGMYDYRFDRIWADHNPFLWRLGNLFPHMANGVLLFFLGRRMGLANWAAAFAGLLFGWHGSRPESVTWIAARFDLLAGFFVLAGLLLLFRYAEGPRPLLFVAALVACLCGLLSKESAYVFPILATVLLWRRLPVKVLAAFYGLTAIVFLYRWRLLGGIGGYQTTTSEPTIFILSGIRTANALLMRLWATLWFPINWTENPGPILALAATAMLAAVAWVFWNRPAMHWQALAFVWIAALPVQHLLLIGADLEKSRVLYLPSMGFAILAAFALQSIEKPRAAMLAGLAILAFQFAALQHNLRQWDRTTAASRAACLEVGASIQKTGRDAIVTDLPNMIDGVYFLKNGFPACVEWNTAVPMDRVQTPNSLADVQDSGDRMVFRWDSGQRALTQVR